MKLCLQAEYSPQEKALIGNYAVINGTSAALRHYLKYYPNLKWTTVNDWKTAIIKKKRIDQSKGQFKKIVLLEGK